MPAVHRSGKLNSTTSESSGKDSNGYTAPNVGLYGWRKRCLYILILLITAVATINLLLIIWIMRVQRFGLYGMGNLQITNNGIKMDGIAEFINALRTKQISSRNNYPLKINSRRNILLSALDEDNNVLGQITLTSTQMIMKNKELLIQDQDGRTLLHADSKRMKLNLDNMELTVPGGLNLENSIQTPIVSSSDKAEGLRLESLTKRLFMNAADGIEITSNANNIELSSLKDIMINSKRGKLVLDTSNIQLKNIKKSSVPDSAIYPSNDGKVYGGIAEVCMCPDGKLFLAPPDVQKPCKLTAGVC